MRISDWSSDVCSSDLGTWLEESRRDGINTIEGIRLIKEQLPGVHTTLGLSNISFGLKPAARHVLNSVYLHECQQAGLDSAIVHAGRILPLARIPDERSEEHTSELQSLMRNSYAVFCVKKKNK